jgi:predicted dehydrogenase
MKSKYLITMLAGVILILHCLNTFALAAPTNDNFSSATIISGSSGQTTGDNSDATSETGEPNHVDTEGGTSVWWSWTAPSNGTVVFDTSGSDFDTLLAAYTGSEVGDLTSIASNDDSVDVQSQISFKATAGTNYYIAVDGYDGETGDIVLNWVYGTAPGNDDFSSATPISSSSGQAAGNNSIASFETGEPNHADREGGTSVWWTWTAPSNGTVVFDTSGSDFDTLLAAYTGSEVGDLTSIASNDDYDDNQSQISFETTAGTNYYIAVDGFSGAIGDIVLNWTLINRLPLSALLLLLDDEY